MAEVRGDSEDIHGLTEIFVDGILSVVLNDSVKSTYADSIIEMAEASSSIEGNAPHRK